MGDSLLLSICIPTYNRAAALKEALSSILPQVAERVDVEIVICDNASTDATPDDCRELAATQPRVRYFRSESNVGMDGNVKACFEQARGMYVSLFSDDDVATPAFFTRLIARLEQYRPALLYANHTPFFGGDPVCLGRPQAAVVGPVVLDGRAFFMRFGLGFISALTIRADLGRQFLDRIVLWEGTAHMDIAARVSLSVVAPCVYDGTLMVLARQDEGAGSRILRYGVVHVLRAYERLGAEGFLSVADIQFLRRRNLVPILPRCILNNRCNDEEIFSFTQLMRLFGRDPRFYVAAPLLMIPARWVRAVAVPLRAFVRKRRRVGHG